MKIILICVDALRYDASRILWPYFNILFTQHYTSNNWTLPTTARLLTGIKNNGLNWNKEVKIKNLSEKLKNGLKVPTVAKYLKKDKWKTYAKTEGLFLSKHFGFGKKNEWDNWIEQKGKIATGSKLIEPKFTTNKNEFRFYHDYYVHNYFDDIGFKKENSIKASFGELVNFFSWKGFDELMKWEAAYWRRVANIANLLSWIPRSNSIVILTSDHGEAFREYREDSHHTGTHMVEEIAHIPLLIFWPGKPIVKITQLTRDIDVSPTILDIAGIKKKLDGRSLLPLINDINKKYKSSYSGKYVHSSKELWQFNFSDTKKEIKFIKKL